MNEVFLDTAGLVALWDTDDRWCARATAREGSRARDQALFVRQETWETLKPQTFAGLEAGFSE